ncbi:MAG: tryptophan 2,3-dioxygenase [Verrucomicrobia bacterium]|nr:tryptophan 2,3-dioxygenase [Verrucomicrobiota bacterium]
MAKTKEALLPDDILQKVITLKEKYAAMGQDLGAYLDGLIHADYLTYWDYIHLDTLLSLQNPKTAFPDEQIFIMYHQITELYFKLSLHELQQIGDMENITKEFFIARLRRINNYFKALTTSFGIMRLGMEKEQFLQFRMALLPASGFQSGQYRKIEIFSTEFKNLVDKDHRKEYYELEPNKDNIEKMYEFIYWKKGATELATGEKTLTLKQFENKYSKEFKALALECVNKNIWSKYKGMSEEDQQNEQLIKEIQFLDINVNINWPLVHYKSAARYLQMDPQDIAATGGTNWQKYLPPRFQKRIFYPELWSDEEKENWGKAWVEENVFFQKG